MKNIFTILVLLIASYATAQHCIYGKVLDGISGTPLKKMKIELSTSHGDKLSVFTDSSGCFNVKCNADTCAFTVNTANYRSKKGDRYSTCSKIIILAKQDSIIKVPAIRLKRRALPATIPDLHFKAGSAEVQEYFNGSDTVNLQFCARLLADVLAKQFMVVAEVQGFNEQYEPNASKLSADRAEKVRAALEGQRVDMSRITVKLYGTAIPEGAEPPVITSESKTGEPEVNIMNRRAGFKLTVDESRKPLVFRLEGVVADCNNKVPIENVTINILGSDGYAQEVKTDKYGYYKVSLQADLSYVITTDAKTALKTTYAEIYLTSSKKGKLTTVGETESKTFKKDFCLTPAYIEVNFPAITYEFGKATLTAGAVDSLDILYRILLDNPAIVIELSSHCDSREAGAFPNTKLSQARSQVCVDYLVSKGIPKERLVPKGYGCTKLLVKDAEIAKLNTPGEKEAAHQKNRRTVFKVLRWDYPAPGNNPPLIRPKSSGEEKEELDES